MPPFSFFSGAHFLPRATQNSAKMFILAKMNAQQLSLSLSQTTSLKHLLGRSCVDASFRVGYVWSLKWLEHTIVKILLGVCKAGS